MQQVKTYTSGLFKGEARYQFLKNLKKMTKDGWHVHTLTDEGVGRGQAHTGRYKVVFEKQFSEYQAWQLINLRPNPSDKQHLRYHGLR